MEKYQVSYSQFKMWSECPYKWKRSYIDKHKESDPSIHLIFGSAMHTTIQLYLTGLYSQGVEYSEQIPVREILRTELSKEYNLSRKDILKNFVDNTLTEKDQTKKVNELIDVYVSKQDMVEFYYDGEKILDWLKKRRVEFFNIKDEELVAIEFELSKGLRLDLDFIAYIDIIIKNKRTGKLRIIDLKTSTKGWNSYKKNDSKTTDQIVLYKHFYSQRYNVEPNNINVEFIILKRKLYEDIPYPQKRILKYIPPSGKPTINRTMVRFNGFLDSCFNADGNINKDGVYPKIATDNNCRFCPFVDKPELCDRKN